METSDERLQKQDEEQRFFELLQALQKVDRAGLHDEALLLAWGCGMMTDFTKEQEHARQG